MSDFDDNEDELRTLSIILELNVGTGQIYITGLRALLDEYRIGIKQLASGNLNEGFIKQLVDNPTKIPLSPDDAALLVSKVSKLVDVGLGELSFPTAVKTFGLSGDLYRDSRNFIVDNGDTANLYKYLKESVENYGGSSSLGNTAFAGTDDLKKTFENARVQLAEVLTDLEGINDPKEIGLSGQELKVVVGHLRACSEMLKDYYVSRGLLNDTVSLLAMQKTEKSDPLDVLAKLATLLSLLLTLLS
tara:strand:- start:6799 stop:7536 length:738 start_codon:yes stop_codon:yes gene_type:complete